MLALILFSSLAISVSFICSLLEASILSITPVHISILNQNGKKYAQRLMHFKEDINYPLSAILTLNTIANTIGAAGVGAQVQVVFGDGYLALSSALLTSAILILSEIIPKTLGARFCFSLAGFTTYALQIMILITYPIVELTKWLTQLFPPLEEDRDWSRSEVIATAELNKNRGSLHSKESNVIKNLLQLEKLSVKDAMTPRSQLFGVQKDQSIDEVIKLEQVRYSRIPIYGEDFDDIKGIVHRYQIYEAQKHNITQQKVESIVKPVFYVSESISISNVLDEFFRRKQQVFIVVDAYGSTSGIISLEDAIESLLGMDIVDEYDLEESAHHYIQFSKEDPKKLIIKTGQ